jgi:hypothetical protein
MRLPPITARLSELANSRVQAEINIANSYNALVSLNHELNGRFAMLTIPPNTPATGTLLRLTEAYLTEFCNAHRRLVTATARYWGHVSDAQRIIDEQATLEKELAEIQVLLPNGNEAI